jgi:hypothetical protein
LLPLLCVVYQVSLKENISLEHRPPFEFPLRMGVCSLLTNFATLPEDSRNTASGLTTGRFNSSGCRRGRAMSLVLKPIKVESTAPPPIFPATAGRQESMSIFREYFRG